MVRIGQLRRICLALVAIGMLSSVIPVVATEPQTPAGIEVNAVEVRNPEVLDGLTETQQALFSRNGFVVVPSGPQQIYAIYRAAAKRGWPVFVTPDALLHAYHVLYDYALRQAELDFFVPALQDLTTAMLDASHRQAQETSGDVQAAARNNIAFFAVARRLLDSSAPVPPEAADLVESELRLIDAHAGIAPSPIFGYDEDYSQYVPRGHYTRNETFGRYFRAMMWLGRMAFHPRPGEDAQAVARGRAETRQALLIVAALQLVRGQSDTARALWEKIYRPTTFFVGRSDDLNAEDYAGLIGQVYEDRLTPADLADDARLDRFIDAALKLRAPRIVSSPVSDQQKLPEASFGFRFMGQRFVFDSYIFQQLVYEQVKLYRGNGEPFTLVRSDAGSIRGFPRGLDIAAVFGSDRALETLKAEGDTDYEGYDQQMAGLRAEVQALKPEQWNENLYWRWLYALQALLEPEGQSHPQFMRGMPWTDRELFAFLGSWTELRHDTILYAKQSMTVRATALEPQPAVARGYVEPQTELYARLASLARETVSGLQGYGVLSDDMAQRFEQMAGLVEALRDMSERELRGEPIGDPQQQMLVDIGERLEALTTFTQITDKEMSTEADDRMAVVADVHTDPNSGQVLEEGVGDAFQIFAAVPLDGQLLAAIGGTFSYYEFKQPMSERLTDEAWQALERFPPRPAWTSSFIAE